jgi:uncharacterized protein YgiM (DUF1202 family)
MKVNYSNFIPDEKRDVQNNEDIKQLTLKKEEKTHITPPKEPTTMIVTNCLRLNVRSEPNTDGSILCIVDAGNKVMVEDIKEKWAHVYTEAGIEGYTMDYFLEVENRG